MRGEDAGKLKNNNVKLRWWMVVGGGGGWWVVREDFRDSPRVAIKSF